VRVLKVFGLCGLVVACVGASETGPALADGTDPNFPGSVLHVKATGALTPGSILTITATGTNGPVNGNGTFSYGLDLALVAANALPSCATSSSAEQTITGNNPRYGSWLTFHVLDEGMSGPFTLTTPVTLNRGTGPVRICAYSVYGVGDDAAWASTEVTIARGGGTSSEFSFRRVTLGGASGCWPLATTTSERELGLGGVRHPALPMVFTFQKPGSHPFTMTGVPAPLTGVWIGRMGTVIGHWHGTPNSKTLHTPPMPITKAVLYPVGWRIPADGARLRLGARCKSSGTL